MVQVMEVPAGARVELERMARSSVLPHRQVVQAKALLPLADGRSLRSTAEELGTYPNTVAAWRDRFLAAGVDDIITKVKRGRAALDRVTESATHYERPFPPRGSGIPLCG